MKKINLLVILLTAVVLTSCGTAKNTAPTPSTSVPPESASSDPMQFMKGYPYFPPYPGMIYKTIAGPDEKGSASAVYLVKDSDSEDVRDSYEKLLNKNGWDTTNKTSTQITVSKDGHDVKINIYQYGKDTLVNIVAVVAKQ